MKQNVLNVRSFFFVDNTVRSSACPTIVLVYGGCVYFGIATLLTCGSRYSIDIFDYLTGQRVNTLEMDSKHFDTDYLGKFMPEYIFWAISELESSFFDSPIVNNDKSILSLLQSSEGVYRVIEVPE